MTIRKGDEQVCSNCGAPATVNEGIYQFKESGLTNVSLCGVELITCDTCGNIDPIIPNANDLMAVLAWTIATRKYRLFGEEVRFLRKYLKMSGVEFAKMIGVDKATLSKWENNDDRVGGSSDRLIRSVVLTLGDGLNDKAAEGVRNFDWIVEEYRAEQMSVDMETLEVQTV
jgi:DNA-binding transcriptional regulator YiaG